MTMPPPHQPPHPTKPQRQPGHTPAPAEGSSRRWGVTGRRAWVWAMGLLMAFAPLAQAQTLKGWSEWKAAFMQADGRVLDTAQQNISHSEGQGFAMVLATAANDRAAFDALWTWTQNNLGTSRNDGLFAWRWEPGRAVTDANTATDGDLFIAWGLARAAAQFKHPPYKEQAARIAKAVREKTVVDGTPWGTVLKPGVGGFDAPRGLVVNMSYWVFPAFDELNRVDPSPQWAALTKSGLRLNEVAQFGRWKLPPDWLLLVNPLEPDPGHLPRHGYDATRIPLYLYWAKLAEPSKLVSFNQFWGHFKCDAFLPGWANVLDNSIDSYGADPGVVAIRTLVTTGKAPSSKPPMVSQGYYSATLGLLVDVAAREGGRK